MRVADFFCGGGGFSEGFRQAGFNIVFAVDKWEPAITTYKGNKPGVNAILDDVIRISNLPDDEFEALVPDSEVIIGSPPCQSFSHSNKSGNADKSIGIQLIEAYLKIIARKKYKKNSILKYWVLENVPSVKEYIKSEYTAADLGLEGSFVLKPHEGNSGKYNAKYYGAPTNRERYLCGEFPPLQQTNTDDNVKTLADVLASLGDPLSQTPNEVTDLNYPTLVLPKNQVTDHQYIYELAPFEWKTAERLKRDKVYMGKMSFPENLSKPARTVMATMTASSREAMILGYKKGKYRLPTVREAATMMSFPIDYWFYGKTKSIKHTLVGNAVPPKMSYAIAKAIMLKEGERLPAQYPLIHHDDNIAFVNLNGNIFPQKQEKERRSTAKFKYHIPYLIQSKYRVELTNYHSNFGDEEHSPAFKWDAEIHYSQGKDKAKVYTPQLTLSQIDENLRPFVKEFIRQKCDNLSSYNDFQARYCMTTKGRKKSNVIGPYELLEEVKAFLVKTIPEQQFQNQVYLQEDPQTLPLAIATGYIILNQITHEMGGK